MHRRSGTSVLSVTLATCSVALSLYLVANLLGLAGRGIDFTDEGYYLNWISNPWAYAPETSQFGFVYHPFYRLLNGDVAGLRQLSIIVNFVLAFLVAFYATRPTGQSTVDWPGNLVRAAIGFSIATVTFLLYRLWLPTPSYNSLALLSALVFAGGMLATRTPDGRKRFAGWHIMSIAVLLALAAKPTTAVMLTILAVGYALTSRRFRLVELLSASALFAVLFAIFAWTSHGGPQHLVASLLEGAATAASLTDSYTIQGVLRFDEVSLSLDEMLAFYMAVFVLAVCGTTFATPWGFALTATSTAFLLVLTTVQTLTGSPFYSLQSPQFGLLLLAVPAGALVSLAVRSFGRRQLSILADVDWHTAVVFILLPLAFILGSGGNYWTGAVGAGLFWPLAGLMMLNGPQTSIARLLPAAAFAQAVTILVVAVSISAPYRQPEPLSTQNTELVYGAGHSLFLAPEVQRYLTDLRAAATQNGFRPGDHMLDLTGHHPGTLFAIGAQSLGRAWLLGGYPGSYDLAVRTLRTVPCEQLVRAWILLEQGGPREIPFTVLDGFGLDAVHDYDWIPPVNSLTEGDGGVLAHVLLRPRPGNIQVCR
jgi:hypothetical protein